MSGAPLLHHVPEAVFRLYGLVVESEFGYDGAVDTFRCPIETLCQVTHREGLKRRGARLVYDLPSRNIRLRLGDVTTQGAGFQSQPDLLGLSVQQTERMFAPGQSLQPMGRSSLRIERPSDVDVVINGTIVQRLQLRPGTYNLRDLPLQTGANDIQLVITDDTGARRTLDYTAYSDAALLAKGKAEWAGSVGVPSYLKDNERNYRSNAWIGTVFARYGISDQMTGEANFQGDEAVLLGGLSLHSALRFGFLGLQGAVSQSNSGIGYAASATYDLANIKGLAFGLMGARESLRLSAEYRSDDYRTPGEFQATASGILLPQFNYSWRFAAAYSLPLTSAISASVAGRYQIGNDKAFQISPLSLSRDRYGVDLTLSAPITDWFSGSLSVGYGNDSLLRDVSAAAKDDPEFRVGVRFNMRLGEKTRVSGSYDSYYKDANVSGSWSDQKGYERWDASASATRNGVGDTTSGSAGVGYSGNRGEVRASHFSGYADGKGIAGDDRSSISAGAAIAFADGAVAVGAPIRGNGFAIVKPHETIADKDVIVGSKEEPRAKTDWLGPALVGNLQAYAPSTLPVDVANLPTGYSLGRGGFDIFAPYRGGYALEVGSAFSVSAYGTLHNVGGEPVALVTGTAKSEAHPDKEAAIFTNAAGKFGAEGLAPGRWTIEMATEGSATRFAIDIPKGTDGLFKAGTLTPVGASVITAPATKAAEDKAAEGKAPEGKALERQAP